MHQRTFTKEISHRQAVNSVAEQAGGEPSYFFRIHVSGTGLQQALLYKGLLLWYLINM